MSTDGNNTDNALYVKFSEAVTSITDSYKEAKADGSISVSDIIALLGTAVSEMVTVAEAFHDGDGSAKKAAVLAAIDMFYDEVVAPVDIDKIPNFIEPIVDKGLKQLLIVVADGTIDAVVAIFNKGGWPPTPDAPDTPDTPVEPTT